MKSTIHIHVLTALAIFSLAVPTVQAQVPNLLSYQGRVAVGTTNFSGTGQFSFALVNTNGTTTYWSNDGTSSGGSQPTSAVSLSVGNGLYSVLLGDTTLTNMTAIPISVWTNPDVRLRVWFNDGTHGFQLLSPDRRLGTSGFLPDSSVTANKIASGAVGSTQLGANAIQATNIAAGAVGSTQLASGLTLAGSTAFTGTIALPITAASNTGVITQNGTSLLQTYGTQNLFAGSGAGNFTMGGAGNTGLGNIALANNTSGNNNVALGDAALYSNTTGYQNTAVGTSAMIQNSGGTNNTAIGSGALSSNTIGSSNTVLGQSALYQNSTAGQNVAMGCNTLNNLTFSNGGTAWTSNDVALGYRALYSDQPTSVSTGINNTAVGSFAMFSNTTGSSNISLGYNSGYNLTTGSNNIDIGSQGVAGESNIIRIGDGFTQTDTYLTGAVHIPSLPTLSLPTSTNLTTGVITQNGNSLLHTYGSFNFFAGQSAGNFSMSGNSNTSIGYLTLADDTTGGSNTALGTYALADDTSGGINTAVGVSALQSNTTGNQNTAVGVSAMGLTSTGSFNTALGCDALFNNTIGGFNVAVGQSALVDNTTAAQNVAIGMNALDNLSFSNGGTAWNSNNVAVGYRTMFNDQPTSTTTGINNTAVGNFGLYSNTTGSNNIALGYNAGYNLSGSNNIDIGSQGASGESNTIRIGDGSTQTAAFITGISGATSSGGAAVYVNSNGQLGTLTSSRRFKEGIRDMTSASEAIYSLRPVAFRYKSEIDPAGIPQFGLIAEEVNDVNPDLVVRDQHGQVQTVRYEQINSMLLNEFLKDHRRADEDEVELSKLREENAAMKQRLAEMEAKERAREERLEKLERFIPQAAAAESH